MDKLSIPSMLCMYGSRCFSQDDWIWYILMLWLLLTSTCVSLFLCLKAYFFCMTTFAQCTNQDSNCVYAGKNLWHKIWYQYMRHNGMVCMLWEVWSLMCTSNVADNTQMASLDRQVTQNGLEVINAICKGNIQWCRRGYRPWRWWEAVLPMSTRF